MSAIKYSTSIGIGCGIYDALQSSLGLDGQSQSWYGKGARFVANRVIAAGCVFAVPAYLETITNGVRAIEYLNPTLRNRMRLSILYNGANTVGHCAAGAYHLFKGNYDKSANDFKKACKFGWRAGLDAALLYYAPFGFLREISYLEGIANAFIPQKLREGLNFLTGLIDDRIIEKTDETLPNAVNMRLGLYFSADFIEKAGGLFRRVMRGKSAHYVPVSLDGPLRKDEPGLYYRTKVVAGRKTAYVEVFHYN